MRHKATYMDGIRRVVDIPYAWEKLEKSWGVLEYGGLVRLFKV